MRPPWESLRERQDATAEEFKRRDTEARMGMRYAKVKVSKQKFRIMQHGGFLFRGETPICTFHFVSGPLGSVDANEFLYKLQRDEMKPQELPGYEEEPY